MKREYTISEVSELLSITESKIRYIEKILDIEVYRDKLNNRIYTEKTVELINEIISYRKNGIGYKEIRSMINKRASGRDVINEVAVTVVDNREVNNDNSFMVYGEDLEKTIEKIQDFINNKFESVEDKIEKSQKIMVREMYEIKKQNQITQEKLNMQVEREEMERHFKELDSKMSSIIEDAKEKYEKSNTGFLRKLFKKKDKK